MKTALQELIEFIELNIDDNDFIKHQVLEEADKALEKEKEQIKDAWDAGMSEGVGTTMADLDYDGEFINYYNQTFNQNK